MGGAIDCEMTVAHALSEIEICQTDVELEPKS